MRGRTAETSRRWTTSSGPCSPARRAAATWCTSRWSPPGTPGTPTRIRRCPAPSRTHFAPTASIGCTPTRSRRWSYARAGRDVLVVTGTASGKSLAYQLPVLETLLRDPDAGALFLFPTKALEQDQLKSLQRLIPWGSGIRAEILDGDTPAHRRAQLREEVPHILISNPDILHLSLLPHHAAWKTFWERLRCDRPGRTAHL